MGSHFQTNAFKVAKARKITLRELAERSGLNLRTLAYVKAGEHGVSADFIAGILRAFPDLTFERLFTPTD